MIIVKFLVKYVALLILANIKLDTVMRNKHVLETKSVAITSAVQNVLLEKMNVVHHNTVMKTQEHALPNHNVDLEPTENNVKTDSTVFQEHVAVR